MILVTWKLADGKTGSAEFPDSQLDDVLQRTWRKFGKDTGTESEVYGVHETTQGQYQGRYLEAIKQKNRNL